MSICYTYSVMTYYWLVANLIKEYAREHRDGNKNLDKFFKDLREVVDSDLEENDIDERMKEYDLYDSWNDEAGA